MGELIMFPAPRPKLNPEEWAAFLLDQKQRLARQREEREAAATDDPA